MREFRQPRFESLVRGLLDLMQVFGQLRIRFTQLRTELQQPCEAVRPLEARSSFCAKIGGFLRDVLGCKTLLQRIVRARRERRIGERARESRQQPMPVNGRVPVITTEKRRGQLARRRDIGIGVEAVRNLVGILLVNSHQREIRKSLCSASIKLRGNREHESELQHQRRMCMKMYPTRISAITTMITIATIMLRDVPLDATCS